MTVPVFDLVCPPPSHTRSHLRIIHENPLILCIQSDHVQLLCACHTFLNCKRSKKFNLLQHGMCVAVLLSCMSENSKHRVKHCGWKCTTSIRWWSSFSRRIQICVQIWVKSSQSWVMWSANWKFELVVILPDWYRDTQTGGKPGNTTVLKLKVSKTVNSP